MHAYFNGTIFNGQTTVSGLAVLTEGGTITALVPENEIPTLAEKIDLRGALLAPAFLDIQIYGGNGMLFGEFPSAEALRATHAYCVAGGATCFLPTVATNTEAVMYAAIDAVRQYWAEGGRGVPGLHLEGPYINPKKRGAHLEACIRTPDLEQVQELLDYGKGVIRMITLAPELCPPEVLDYLLRQNILISAGHSNASYRQGMAAFDAGIPLATHLFNAMSALQHREPGLVGAILDHPRPRVSVVADGHHVDFAAIRLAQKLLRERLFLITDAVTESLHGQYAHRLEGDKYVVADGTLSGSALTMVQAVRNMVEQVGVAPEEALRMASLYPAQALGLEGHYGKIEPGFAESFVLLDEYLNLLQVIDV
ncbi:MAG: N-acetylglucosamine-6-phosphate deacetylase [Saprospiraceae bacterium]|nr:N-acetylglucosamine-6-phosphate deacetylase [Saprospiraceae bacterium]